MKKMFGSLRIFMGNYSFLTVLEMTAGFFVVFGIFALLSAIEFPPESFAAGFFSSFAPAITMFVPLLGSFMLNTIYTYNNPIVPGFKYLHSIPDSDKHYVRAIVVGNIVAAVVMVIAALVQMLISTLLGVQIASPLISVVVVVLALGLVNLSGNSKKSWVRTVLLMPVFIVAGMTFGYSAALAEDGERIPAIVLWIALAVAAVVYIAGLIYTLKVSAKKWRESE